MTMGIREMLLGGAAPLALASLSLLAGCGGGQPAGSNPPPPPALELAVDANLQPPSQSLPGLDGGPPRPLATLADAEGIEVDFVANEVVVTTSDDAVLKGFLGRWKGVVLRTFDPSALGLPAVQHPLQHLVRVDAGAADAGALAADVRTLFANAQGSYRVSSQDGLRLLAVAAREAAGGLGAGVNFVLRGAQFRDRTAGEAPTGPGGYAYDPNSFTWPHLTAGPPLRMGVAEAWRALDLVGRLGNRVSIAIVDGGFAPNADWPAGAVTVGPLNTPNPGRCTGGTECRWHGSGVFGAAMAVAGNGYGSAGPAGPIARPIVISVPGDLFTAVEAIGDAIRQAGDLRPRIVNISASAALPAILEWAGRWSADSISGFVRGLGILIFAAAGNDGDDVDRQDCLVVLGITLGCWERTWYVPCELAGVTCVGGIGDPNAFSTSRDLSSNYGTNASTDTVDLFGPWAVWVGPDPDHTANAVQWDNGTSVATPFVAGVAGLVWAANPGFTASQVESCLLSTVRPTTPNPAGDVAYVNAGYVDAYRSVTCGLGSAPPEVAITSPANLASFYAGSPVRFTAVATDAEDGALTPTWRIGTGPAVGTGASFTWTFPAVGTFLVTATAVDSTRLQVSDQVTIHVVTNLPPAVRITNPATDTGFDNLAYQYDGRDPVTGYWYKDVVLQGTATDPEDGVLPGTSLAWTTSRPPLASGLPGSGSSRAVRLYSNVCTGIEHVIALTATDRGGATGTAVRRIFIWQLC